MIHPSPNAPWNDASFLRSVHIVPEEDETAWLLREFARAERAAQAERDRINRSRGWVGIILGALVLNIFMFGGMWLAAAL